MITNIKYLCYVLKTHINNIRSIIANIDDYYISWEKTKINKDTNLPIMEKGKLRTRQLNSTRTELKKIQKRIYKFLLSKVNIPEYAYGGVPQKDNVLNAKQHQGNKFIFTTDLKSYFPSISNTQIFNLYIELGCTPEISRILTQLTTYKYQLPQGVPTSTLLANLVFKKTGDKIENFAKKNDIKFTSFVDDLTFSSKKCFKDKCRIILEILTKDGFKISHQKTFYKTKNPIITGVICQNNRLKLSQHHYKRISRLKSNIQLGQRLRYEGLLQYRQKIEKSN